MKIYYIIGTDPETKKSIPFTKWKRLEDAQHLCDDMNMIECNGWIYSIMEREEEDHDTI